MDIIKIESGFAIKFPFELKDNFRKAFPSAKWNSLAKQWEVGPRSGGRLEQWVQAARGAAEAIEEFDQHELAAEELAVLRRDLDAIEKRTRDLIAERASAEENKAALAELASKIEAAESGRAAAKAEAASAKQAEAAEKQRIDSLLGEIVDLDEIRWAKQVMERNMIPADRQAKEKFEEAKESVRAQRELLLTAGWRCRAIEKLATANVNRPDRDHPRHILASDWYDLWVAEREVD